MTAAATNNNAPNSIAVAAAVAHEVRIPLATIRLQALMISQFWPALYEGYQLAVHHGLCAPTIQPLALGNLSHVAKDIAHEVDHSNTVIDMMLASARMEHLDKSAFKHHSIKACLSEALVRYPFEVNEREKISVCQCEDFSFYGSDSLLVNVMLNLLKNALYAIHVAGKGKIEIATSPGLTLNVLQLTDTGTGVPSDILPHIFDTFYTTKQGTGAGIGLAFCQRVMASFGGDIRCDSVMGQYTTFSLEFPCHP